MTKLDLSRRQFINISSVFAGLYAMAGTRLPVVAQDATTSVDALFGQKTKIPFIGLTEGGPFKPPGEIPWLRDFTSVGGLGKRPSGQIVYLFGTIQDVKGRPLKDTTVEIWQADINGRYRHPRAGEQGQLDPNFGYFGRVRTAPDGSYLFKTIWPGSYQVFGMERAPHIHITMRHIDHGDLTTEMYFSGKNDDEIRRKDKVFQSRFNPDRLIVETESPKKYEHLKIAIEPDAVCCQYDLAFLF